jgi:hypothetical protein
MVLPEAVRIGVSIVMVLGPYYSVTEQLNLLLCPNKLEGFIPPLGGEDVNAACSVGIQQASVGGAFELLL